MIETNGIQFADQNADLRSQPKVSLIRWTHGLVNRIVMLTDGLLLLAATLTFWMSSSPEQRSFTWLQAGAIAIITMIGFHTVMGWMRCYRVERYDGMRRSVTDVCSAALIAAIPTIVIIIAFLPDVTTHPSWLVGWTASTFIGLTLGRALARLLVYFIRKYSLLRSRTIIVGTSPVSDDIFNRLSNPTIARDYELLGVIDPFANNAQHENNGAVGVGTTLADLTRYAQNYAVDLVIIALPWARSAEIFDLTRRLQWIAADVVVPFAAAGLHPQFVPQRAFSDAPLLQLMHRPFKGTQGLFKVIEDYLIGTIGLILVSPILLAAAIAIRLEGPGPILFQQLRVGFNSKPFLIYKLRTMTVDPSDDGSLGTKRDSQRITKVGRFLRRTSIDELPQLINVLRGEMSIVGPRPHVAKMVVEDGVYSDVVQQYAARHRIKPGITGWAQINGMRGGLDSLEKASRSADLDLYYVANWSPKFDLEIMVRTITSGLIGNNIF
jgi:putative colanic acid biosynthesis UDP-glucose lipid carrier transferase